MTSMTAVVLMFALATLSVKPCHGALVDTTTGMVQGSVQDGVRSFLSIPFAQPPIGDLRFRPAQAVDPWSETFQANTPGPACMQPPHVLYPVQSEDCLTLNIMTPEVMDRALPVMIYIYGGSFNSGGGLPFNGSTLVSNVNDVIWVSFNYRLNLLGFAAVSDPAEGPTGGMNGITDQVMAIQWVVDNAAAFGGNPGNVTVLGESAGALSTCMLAVSPVAAGLFQRIILLSGACNGPWGPVPMDVGMSIGRALMAGLGVTTFAELQNVSYADYLSLGADAPPPSLDGYVLTEHPSVTYANTALPYTSILAGVTALDGLFPFIPDSQVPRPQTNKEFQNGVTNYFGESIGAALSAVYLYADNLPADVLSLLWSTMNSDAVLGCPTLALLDDIAAVKGSQPSLYFYEFAWPDPKWGFALHAGELSTLFGDVISPLFSAPEPALTMVLQQFWSSFGASGMPSSEAAHTTWPPFDRDQDSVGLVLNIPVPLTLLDDTFKKPQCAIFDTLPKDEVLAFGLIDPPPDYTQHDTQHSTPAAPLVWPWVLGSICLFFLGLFCVMRRKKTEPAADRGYVPL